MINNLTKPGQFSTCTTVRDQWIEQCPESKKVGCYYSCVVKHRLDLFLGNSQKMSIRVLLIAELNSKLHNNVHHLGYLRIVAFQVPIVEAMH